MKGVLLERNWSVFLFLIALLTPSAPIDAENIIYPPNAGVLNVRDAKYGAKGDGKTDDTAAIQKALTEGLYSHHIIYVPNGVYLVSNTLKWQNPANAGNNVGGWRPFLQLQGQSRAGTVFRLKDKAPGFGDDSAPKAVISNRLQRVGRQQALHQWRGQRGV